MTPTVSALHRGARTGGYKRSGSHPRGMTDDEGTDAVPDDIAASVQEYVENRHDFLAWLNTSVDDIAVGRVVLSVPYDEKLTNRPPGWAESDGGAGDGADADRTYSIHGGVAATLVDTAGGMALRTRFDDPRTGDLATVNLNVNYLRPATGDLTATADVVRAGRSIGVSEMTVTTTVDGEEKAVATGQGAYRLFREE